MPHNTSKDAASDGQPPTNDLIFRGTKGPNVPGTLTFIGVRSLDPILQYNILVGGWGAALLAKLGLNVLPPGTALITGVPVIDALDIPLPQLILLAMSFGSTVKQVYWLTRIAYEEFPPSASVAVGVINTSFNSLNSLLFLALSTSVLSSSSSAFVNVLGARLPYQVVLGAALYVTGMVLETLSEVQRRSFKDKPQNKGKVMKTGLWSVARHINYTGYSLWRAGYCMAASGFLGGIGWGIFQAYDFVTRAVPSLDEYCAGRYGQQWVQFKKDVPWVILPGVY